MELNGVEIDDTFAEGFSLYASRILITAENIEYAEWAARAATGFAQSTIHCPCEAGIDQRLGADETPDGRPGVSVMFCVVKKNTMDQVLLDRIGQCILTAATTSVFDWFPDEYVSEKTFEVKTGYKLKFFGDGWEEKDTIKWNGKDIPVWKVPTMDGYFVVQNTFRVSKIAGGGNFMMLADSLEHAINASKKAIEAMSKVDGVIMPFPGGFVRSPSKLGSLKYSKFLDASTNHPLLPVLKDKVEDSIVPDGAKAGYEFVINGLTFDLVKEAMRVGITELTKQEGVLKITAGNYGGKLGKLHYHLKEILNL
ncbi:MAG: formylmethanofuran--tetrahydromethanopterin N-formyltransferase [Promethearchaeota archaeon]